MTKEEVLQKVNDYCTEKQYTVATLTDSFKDKFADHFQKANPDGDINEEVNLANLKFALNTAFSSASELATVKVNEFTAKENDYKNQIAELQKKQTKQTRTEDVIKLPKEVEEQLAELQRFKDAQVKQEKLTDILKKAKTNIRQDLHNSFDKFAEEYAVKDNEDVDAQANSLVKRFQEIFKDSIGDIKPRTPIQTQKQDADFLSSLPVINVC